MATFIPVEDVMMKQKIMKLIDMIQNKSLVSNVASYKMSQVIVNNVVSSLHITFVNIASFMMINQANISIIVMDVEFVELEKDWESIIIIVNNVKLVYLLQLSIHIHVEIKAWMLIVLYVVNI